MSRLLPLLTLSVIALGLVLASSQTVAQEGSFDLRWRLPKRTYALYNNVKADQAQAIAQRKVVDKVDSLVAPPKRYFHMFGYETLFADRRDQYMGVFNDTCYPFTVEDMLMQVCFHTTGKTNERVGDKYERDWKFARMEGFLPLNLHSDYEVVGAAEYGKWQCVAIKSHSGVTNAAAPGDETKAFHVWREFFVDAVTYFDPQEGVVRGAKLSVRGVSYEFTAAAGAVKHYNYYDWDLEWQLARTFDSTQDVDLRRYVDSAIARGRQRLMEMSDANGLWPYGGHPRGGTALSLLALLICGIPANDPKIAAAFAAIQPMELVNNYEVAVSLMAYEAKYISEEEKLRWLDKKKGDQKRDISPDDKREMQRLLDWMIQNQNKKNPFWNYKYEPAATERYDLSNTQYSLLALGTALRCGLKVPVGVIRTHVDELRKIQEKDGPEIKRVIDGKPPRPGKSGQTATSDEREPRFTRAPKSVKARGWGYTVATYDAKTGISGAWGSMNCSGLTCMMIALDIAAQLGPERQAQEFGSLVNYNSWRQQAVGSFESGLAWQEVHFSVTRNANLGRTWYLYYLYGLERVGILCDVRYLGEHDWYAEGASALICLQSGAGDWGDAVDTSFALLFLKRGTVPLKTPAPTHDKSIPGLTRFSE